MPLLLAVSNFEYNYKHEHGFITGGDTMSGGTWGYQYLSISLLWLMLVIVAWLIVLAFGKGNAVFNCFSSKNGDLG